MTLPGSSVLVYHAHDGESRLMAELVRLCDPDGQFEFLPLHDADGAARMEQFLLTHAPNQPKPQPPFVIVLHHTGNEDEIRRSIVVGAPLHDWFEGLVNAVLPRARDLRPAIARCLSRHTLRLIASAWPPVTRSPLKRNTCDRPRPVPPRAGRR